MSRVVIRIGETKRDMSIVPAFAVDIEERKNADGKSVRIRVENEHQRLADLLRAGFADMLVEKSALSYCGAKVIITIKQVYRKRNESSTDGACRVDVQTKPNCPKEFVEGAWKIYHSIYNSPKIAAAVAEEQRKQRELLAAKRAQCPNRHGCYCAPVNPQCPCYKDGNCVEV